jgi:hypothetical protein
MVDGFVKERKGTLRINLFKKEEETWQLRKAPDWRKRFGRDWKK